ncbi:MAG: sensor histidine kinase [Planctomycetaceae bacterium]
MRDSRRRLQDMSRQLIVTRENERRHLARELHDEIGQSLTGIRLNVKAMQLALGSTNLSLTQETLANVDRTLEQVRSLALNLRPSMLDDIGLIAALRWCLDRQAKIVGFAAQFLTDELFQGASKDMETACFRVAQESLTNIARHAKARHVRLELRTSESEWVLLVIDDGVGFDAAFARIRSPQSTGLGLLGMQERVELVGGTLKINSSATSGTVVCARFPIDTQQSGPATQTSPVTQSDGFGDQRR